MLASTKNNSDSKWRKKIQCATQSHKTDAYFSFTHQMWKIKENTLLKFCPMLKFKKTQENLT